MKDQLQRRFVAGDIQIRKNPDGTYGVKGYAAVFGQTAYGERIMPSAFNRTLAQQDDIRLLVNHEGVPIARTKSGTLRMGVDDHGEWFDAPNLDPANPDVQRLVSAMDRRDIDQCSFAGYFTDVRTGDDGVDEVYEVKQQTDVSIVTYPWYDETSVSLTGDRDLDRAALAVRSLTPEQRTRLAELVTEREEEDEPVLDLEQSAKDITEALNERDAETEEAVEAPRTFTIAEARALLAPRAGRPAA